MSEQKCPKCGRPLEEGKPCLVCAFQLAASPTTALAADLNGIDGTSDWQLNESQPPKRPEIDIETLRAAFPQLEIIESIGCGGMGSVFKARQPKLDRFVALKILATDNLTGTPLPPRPGFAERFAQEGKLLAKLNHPNIVAVYDVGESGGFYYLMMEHVDGVNLRQAMRTERITPEQAIAIVPKICEALQYAHEEGVLHRDIKPENILLDTKGRVKIADFGIAKLVGNQSPSDQVGCRPPGGNVGDSRPTSGESFRSFQSADADTTARRSVAYQENPLTQAGQVLGTPSYMAPEQLVDPHRVDHRADIYSLGVVFYELLTGELPRGSFPVPSERTPVGANIDNVVMKALHKERDKRQQSAKEFKTEIETAEHPPKPQTEPQSLDGEPETAWQKFWTRSLWIMIACFGLFVAIPSALLLASWVVDSLYYGKSFVKMKDILFNQSPIVVFITAILMMRYRRLKTPFQSHDKFVKPIIVLLGLVIPFISHISGAMLLGFKPFFADPKFWDISFRGGIALIVLPHLIVIVTALMMYRVSRHFGNRLKYLPVICGYSGWAYLYFGFDIASDAQAAIGFIFIPFWSLCFFIGGYWVAWGIHVVMKALHKERDKRQQSAKEFKTEIETAEHPPTNAPRMSKSGEEPETARRKHRITINTVITCILLGIATLVILVHSLVVAVVGKVAPDFLGEQATADTTDITVIFATGMVTMLYVVLVGVPVLIAYVLCYRFWILRLWEEIPQEFARTTPKTAASLSLVPVFNLYWMFVALGGLYKDMNKVMEAQGHSKRFNTTIITTACIIWLAGNLAMFMEMDATLSLVGALLLSIFTIVLYWIIRRDVLEFIDIKGSLAER